MMESHNHQTTSRTRTTTSRKLQQQLMDLEPIVSPLRISFRPRAPLPDVRRSSYATKVSVCNVVRGTDSGEIDLDDNTYKDSTPFCLVCHNDNRSTSQYQQTMNIKQILWTRNQTFLHGEHTTIEEASSSRERTPSNDTVATVLTVANVTGQLTGIVQCQQT